MIEWWNNIVFAYPWVLWFALIIPVLFAVQQWINAGKKSLLTLPTLPFLNKTGTPGLVHWRPVLHVLRALTILMIIIVAARPQAKSGWKKIKGEGIDIMLSIDVSPSMQAVDFPPNRLEAAKQEAIKFVKQRYNDRIGIVVFSGEAFTVCPLTTDHDALVNMIQGINLGSLEMGTAIGMGLAKACERLKTSKAKSKVVILLTDGENNQGVIAPEDAGRLAQALDIRVYAIGMSGRKKTLVPTQVNPDGSYVQQYQQPDIDEESLQNIAQGTGGLYFRAADANKLEQIYSEINRLEKTAFDRNETEQRKEEYLVFSIIAALCMAIELVLRKTLFNTLT